MKTLEGILSIALLVMLFGCTTGINSWNPHADPILKNDPIQLAIQHYEHHASIEWMGCHGFGPYIPSVPNEVEWDYFDGNIHWIKGTGDDCPISVEYNQPAEDFAKRYNEKRISLKNSRPPLSPFE